MPVRCMPKNLFNLVSPFISEEGELALDISDEVIAGCLLTHDGAIVHAQYKKYKTKVVQNND